jgi:hypothetical protein
MAKVWSPTRKPILLWVFSWWDQKLALDKTPTNSKQEPQALPLDATLRIPTYPLGQVVDAKWLIYWTMTWALPS